MYAMHMIHKITIPISYQGKRLDKTLAELLPQYSRMCLKNWIDNQKITVNGEFWQPKDKVAGNEIIVLNAELATKTVDQPEAIKLNIIYEDDDILVLNKPAGMVVHPGAGNRQGTLLNALLHHAPQLKKLPRAGIIHRLDKDTSGLLVIAKTITAHTHLTQQLQNRKIVREYEAIVQGELISGATIETDIGRHPRYRTKMAVVTEGKPAITHYRIIEKFQGVTHIKIKLETGRTHQIRVHMAHIHHPIIGDQVYSSRMRFPKNASAKLIAFLKTFKRQALHACKLGLKHPTSGKWMEWTAPIPADIQELLKIISLKLF